MLLYVFSAPNLLLRSVHGRNGGLVSVAVWGHLHVFPGLHVCHLLRAGALPQAPERTRNQMCRWLSTLLGAAKLEQSHIGMLPMACIQSASTRCNCNQLQQLNGNSDVGHGGTHAMRLATMMDGRL